MSVTMTEQQQHQAVARAVIERWGVRDRRGRTNKWWSELFFESGWSRLEKTLSVAEWEDFCGCAVRLVFPGQKSCAASLPDEDA